MARVSQRFDIEAIDTHTRDPYVRIRSDAKGARLLADACRDVQFCDCHQGLQRALRKVARQLDTAAAVCERAPIDDAAADGKA